MERLLLIAMIAAITSSAMITPTNAQRSDGVCGTYLIDDADDAPRAATPNAATLDARLPRICRAGKILRVISRVEDVRDLARRWCDPTREIRFDNLGFAPEVVCFYRPRSRR